MVSCSQAVVRGTTGTCRYGETVRMDKYLTSFISLQKVTPEMITNEATVKNQDEDKASSGPADTSCLKRLKAITFKEMEVELKTTMER